MEQDDLMQTGFAPSCETALGPEDGTGRSLPARQEGSRPLLFSTLDLPASEQFDGWRRFISSTVDLSLVEGREVGFAGRQTVWNLGRFAFTVAEMPGEGYVRRWRHLSRDPLDHWCLVVWRGDPAVPGGARRHMGFRSLARPFVGQGADSKVWSLFIPRDLFPNHAEALDRVPADLSTTGLCGILADHLESLEHRLPGVPGRDLPALVEATRTLLLACLLPTADHVAAARAPMVRSLRAQAHRLIVDQIASPLLTPDRLCRMLGISRSRLYRLFDDRGGVARYIQRQRLLAGLAQLSDGAGMESIVRIAEKVGFADASGFSRAFRQEFGVSPSDARAAARAGTPLIPAMARQRPGAAAGWEPGAAGAGADDLARVLHQLQP